MDFLLRAFVVGSIGFAVGSSDREFTTRDRKHFKSGVFCTRYGFSVGLKVTFREGFKLSEDPLGDGKKRGGAVWHLAGNNVQTISIDFWGF